MQLKDIYKHDAIYKEYPNIAYYRVELSDKLGKDTLGQFDPNGLTIRINSAYWSAAYEP